MDAETERIELPLLQDVERLEAAWREVYPKRATGGIQALSGFRYQFLLVLLETVRAWVQARDQRNLPRVFTERLSDLLRIESGRSVTVAQAKKGAHNLGRALEDLWLIHGLARQATPALARVLTLQVLTSRGDIGHLECLLADWRPGAEIPADHELSDFKNRIQITIEPDPEDELLALLANELSSGSPLDCVLRWLGELQEASGSGDFKGAARRIWNDLTQIGKGDSPRKPPGVVVWSAADHPPAVVKGGECLTGIQPMLRHLREGYFAPRPQVYKSILDRAERWIEEDPIEKDQGHRVPIFWIAGRSGSGKSVALLHLLAALQDRHQVTVVWLANNVENLPSTLRWARELVRPGHRVLIGLDDPFTPGQQTEGLSLWREAMAALLDARESGRSEEVPLLLCCGPTEQAHYLQQELKQDVNLEIYELSRERQEELAELRTWYRQRKGVEPPAIGNRNILLVQLFFEWRTGKTLPAFADHLRRRLWAADPSETLFRFVTHLLALNRLYVGYPPEALESQLGASQRDLLNRLRAEEHIEEDREGRPGLWLAHPHLSNAIYEEWFPVDLAREVRREHLLIATENCFTFAPHPRNRMAPLWALLRLASGRASDLADRVDERTVHILLSDIYRRRTATGQPLALSELPVWVELRGACTDFELSPDPVALATEAVHIGNLEETGLRLTCHKLLQHLDHFPEELRLQATEAVLRLLVEAFPRRWYEWPAIALDALARFEEVRLWSLVGQWARRNPRSRETARFLLRALIVSNAEAGIATTTQRLLADAPADVAWADIGRFFVAKGNVPPAVETWLQRNHLEVTSCFLLSELLKIHFAPATDWARAWAARWHLERLGNYVLEGLCRLDFADSELRIWCCAWIERQLADPSFLLDQMLRLFPADTEVKRLSLSWLQANAATGHLAWGVVWGPLWKASPGNLQLEQLARIWLQSMPKGHGSWNYVWEPLWRVSPADPELTDSARVWLQYAPFGHRLWGNVWFVLAKASPADPELGQIAKNWLQHAPPEHGSWQYVWKPLWKANREDQELLRLARHWLQLAPPEHGSWQYVWEPLWKANPEDQELLRLARHWLRHAPPEHDSWGFVWLDLSKASPADPELGQIAKNWLQLAPPEHDSWGFVWLDLSKASPADPQLDLIARNWLQHAPPEHGSWKYVWEALGAASPADPELGQIARHWLQHAPPEHGSWLYVWKPLWKANPEDQELLRLARHWLQHAPPEHGSWGFAWLDLTKAGPADPELGQIARNWLLTASLDHKSWSFVWETLWKFTLGDAELEKQGRKWIDQTSPTRGGWHFVWVGLWSFFPGDAWLEKRARDWLRVAPPEYGPWRHIWTSLWETFPGDAELEALARNWLQQASFSRDSWGYVWEYLWRFRLDEELEEQGRKWLHDAPPENESWDRVWRALRASYTEDRELVELALEWLQNQKNFQHAAWALVWKCLWDEAPADPEILKWGREWLASIPKGTPHRDLVQDAVTASL